MNPKPPISPDLLPPEWFDATREAMNQHEGVPIRANPAAPGIEVYSINRKAWLPLMLPGGGNTFNSVDERDSVLRRLEGK